MEQGISFRNDNLDKTLNKFKNHPSIRKLEKTLTLLVNLRLNVFL